MPNKKRGQWIRRARKRACKPSSVAQTSDGWSFIWDVGCPTPRCGQPERRAVLADNLVEAGSLSAPIRPCTGWGLPCRLRLRRRGGLLPRRFTLARYRLPGPLAVCSLWHFPSGYPAWALPSILPCGARTFLTSCEARPSGPLTNGCFYTRTSSFQTSIRPQFSQRRILSVRRASTNSWGESCLKHPPQEPFLTATAATPPLTIRRIRS